MELKQNLYDILEIKPLANQKQIEEGFMNQLKTLRELNKETENICHAGVVINQKMKVAHEILEAYMVLTDRNRKKDYDLGFKHGLRDKEMYNKEFLV